MNKDSILAGFVIGAIVPVAGYTVVEFIFELLTQMGVMADVTASTAERRLRTLSLLAICCNLIPFQIAKSKRWDDQMRGIVFPTLVYVGFWVYTFFGVIVR